MKKFLKRFIKLSWHGIPIGIIASVLIGTAVLAATYLSVTQTITQEITPYVPPARYTLTMAVTGSGTTEPAVGDHSLKAGVTQYISATADDGWKFISWTGDVADTSSASTKVIMNANKTVTANFEELDYGSITADPITLGSVMVRDAFDEPNVGTVTVVLSEDIDVGNVYLCLALDEVSVSPYTEYHYKITSPGVSNPTGEEIVLYVNNSVNHKSTQLDEVGTYTFTVDIWGKAGSTVETASVKVDITLEDDSVLAP